MSTAGVNPMTRSIDPIVSTEWLQERVAASSAAVPAAAPPVIIDIRYEEEYAAGHIPGAVSVPFGLNSPWAVSDDVLILELPDDADLFAMLSSCGITVDSEVVVVGRLEEPPAPPYPLADAARAAVTLIYAGIENVAILEGGHPKWDKEERPLTTDVPVIEPRAYEASPDRSWWVSTDYVKDRLGQVTLVDGRDPDQYFGASIDPFADMRGHIPTAHSLPALWLWEPDGTYRSHDLIAGMADGVVGPDKDQEIVTYCGVGGYASTWWFLLTQLLGYKNVKIYDGSMEGWVDLGNSLTRYRWE